MLDLVLLPFRFLFSLIGLIFRLIGSAIGFVFNLVGGVLSVVFTIGSILVIPLLIYVVWKVVKRKK